jgi:hypothetical protein
MGEKPESDEFEDEDDQSIEGGTEEFEVDRIMQDMDKRKRNVARGPEPAWRRLERMAEQKRTSALLSDFEDYDLGDESSPG